MILQHFSGVLKYFQLSHFNNFIVVRTGQQALLQLFAFPSLYLLIKILCDLIHQSVLLLFKPFPFKHSECSLSEDLLPKVKDCSLEQFELFEL